MTEINQQTKKALKAALPEARISVQSGIGTEAGWTNAIVYIHRPEACMCDDANPEIMCNNCKLLREHVAQKALDAIEDIPYKVAHQAGEDPSGHRMLDLKIYFLK